MRPPAGVVLTGGASRRMGTDKALLEVAGMPMAARVADALAGAGCSPVWCQGGDARRLAALGLTVRPDPQPGSGPLGAIAAALAHSGGGAVVAACDLPDLTSEAVRGLLHDPDRPAALASGGRAQLVAWFPPAAAEPLAQLVDDGVVRFGTALERLGAVLVDVDAEVVRNVNTHADL